MLTWSRRPTQLSQYPEIAFSLEEDAQDSSRGLPGEAGAYDWDSYDQYTNSAEDNEEVPEA